MSAKAQKSRMPVIRARRDALRRVDPQAIRRANAHYLFGTLGAASTCVQLDRNSPEFAEIVARLKLEH